MERQAKDGTFYQQVGKDEWTPVTRQAKDGTIYKKVGADQWTPMQQPKDENSYQFAENDQPSIGTAFLDSLSKSASLNYDLPIMAKGDELIEDVGNIFTGGQTDPNFYEKRLADLKSRRTALEKRYPVTSFIGELGGFVLPGAGVAKGVKAAKGALGLGAAKTLGQKAATLGAEGLLLGAATNPEGEDSLSQRALNAGIGAATGAAFPYAAKGVQKIGSGIKKAASKGTKKLVSALGSVSEDNITKFLDDPDRYLSAKTREEVVTNISKVLDDIDNRVVSGKDSVAKAKDNLRVLEREIKEGLTDKQLGLKDALADAKSRLNERFMQVKEQMVSKPAPVKLQNDIADSLGVLRERVSKGSGQGYKILDQLHEISGGAKLDVNDVLESIKNSADDFATEVGTADKAAAKRLGQLYNDIVQKAPDGKLTLRGVKRILQSIDNETTYSQNAGEFDAYVNSALKNVRRNFDAKLKGISPEYRQQMQLVSKDVDLLNRASQSFGTPEKGFVRLSNIAGKKGKLDRDLLQELGQETNKNFVGTIDDYLTTQKTLKSPTRMQDIKQNLAESSEVKKIIGAESSIKRARKPKAIREKLARSKPFLELKKAEFDLKKAQELKNKFVGWSERTAEDKINAVMRNKKFVVKQLDELSKLSDDDFVRAVKDLQVSEAFTKDATRGSRNVNLWSIIGLAISGSVLGGPLGAALGAVTGSLMDRYGPKATKQVLKSVARLKARPTVQSLMKLGIPKNISQDLMDSLVGAGLAAQASMNSRETPEKGRKRWANQGFDNLLKTIENEDMKNQIYSRKNDFMENPKKMKMLIELSRLKPNTKAYKNLKDKILKGE